MVKPGTYPEGMALKKFADLRRVYEGNVVTADQLPDGVIWEKLPSVVKPLEKAFRPKIYNISTLYNGSCNIPHKYLKKVADAIKLTDDERLELYKLAIFRNKDFEPPSHLEMFPRIKDGKNIKEAMENLLAGLCITTTGKPEIKLWRDVLAEAKTNPDILTTHYYVSDAIFGEQFAASDRFITHLKAGTLFFGSEEFIDALPIPKESKIAIVKKAIHFADIDFKTIDQVFSYNNLFDEDGKPKTQGEILRDLRAVHCLDEHGKLKTWQDLFADYIKKPKAEISTIINSAALSINDIASLLSTSKTGVGFWEVGKSGEAYCRITNGHLPALQKVYGLNDQQLAILSNAPTLQALENKQKEWAVKETGGKITLGDYEKMVREYEIERKYGIEFRQSGITR